MSSRPPVELSIDQRRLSAAAKALASEVDGKTLKRNLHKALKAAAEEPIALAKASILATPSQGLTESQPLRPEIARSIKPVSRLTGRTTGVSIRQSQTPNVRGFKMAGRRFNQGSFRRPVYGKAWVTQSGNSEWFDRPMHDAQPEFKADVLRVVQELAHLLAERAHASASK